MIEDLSIAKRKFITSLKSAKTRRETGRFVVEGEKSILDNIGYFDYEMIVGRQAWLADHLMLFKGRVGDIRKCSSADLDRMSSLSTSPEVIAVCKIPELAFYESLLDGRLVVALDNVQDPGNLGTIIRTCDWFGVDTVLCSKGTVDVYNPKVIQATMGALSRVKVYYVELEEVLRHKKSNVYGTFMNGESVYRLNLPSEGVILMGNEGKGIGENLSCCIGNRISIPSYHSQSGTHVESLNVSIATAIILNEFRRTK